MEKISIPALYLVFQKCTGVTTDSRNCPKGSLFIALKGSNFNGNKFAEQALHDGSSYAIVDDPYYVSAENDRIFLVDNTLKALQELAHYHRQQLGTKIIGITGTNGKTTTKELIAAVLSTQYNILYTQGNLNNHIGVPLTLLRLQKEHELAVIEMGASHPGDIKELVDIAEPDFGIITNVGRAHLEGFGSFEGIIRTKGELYDYLRTRNATVFVNAENSYLTAMLEGLTPVYYSGATQKKSFIKNSPSLASDSYTIPSTQKSAYTICGHVTSCSPFLCLEWQHKHDTQTYSIITHLIGDYNLDNVLAATTIGIYFGITPTHINQAIAEYTPSNNRSQLKKTTYNQLIIDAYNANPTSMMASLRNFSQIEASHKIIILGDMKELGPTSKDEHLTILRYVSKCKFERSFFVGNEFTDAFTAETNKNSFPDTFEFYPDVHTLINTLRLHDLLKNKTFLIKGSNSMKLSLLVEEL